MKKKPIAESAFLLVAGAMIVGAGGTMLFAPDVLHAKNGVDIGTNPNLLSEIRAPGAFLLFSGLFVLATLKISRWRNYATALTALIYTSFGVGRVWSLLIDGAPVAGLLVVTLLELSVGIIALVSLSLRTEARQVSL